MNSREFQIDWTERWLLGLVAFHVICLLFILSSGHRTNLQTILFLALLLMTWSTQFVNEYAAQNWRSFASQQYFDSQGLFISIVFSAPALINCLIIVVSRITILLLFIK
ncbi:uncharacterized protein TRIADDRAFT_33664 [Trichoplax adhaerens]|uniref:Transmembrane protein 18 n=1 Tax=Trichoplax adhaerens TaxID=10228 RepID=B3SD27_TRIAD|nr:hypothetical protein TRIADDRAFT_33664 [Trichoplax adhaerens]EDV19386.1 hypothetical protein TRIADDRAFT_33664 [Trichoplax adhaerens]|eukprot:XP_002118161.1 hypothetical protein TRIADDRAFT_33664 [Trichoplax adhaerens]